MTNGNKFDLEERLIDFAVVVSEIVEGLPATRMGNYLAGQLVRSGCSPALNYGEAQSAESRNDFIHKMKIILKELRESLISLKLIERKKIYDLQIVNKAKDECNQLVAIFVKSIETAKKNNTK
ncbi:four helix bundle protein [Mucilaginibacter sp. L3T2-6]|uniref:four helix bundle protein n=1 Tax=Mucilaginibacter sp. L3T2-6 TaxID=3062491 RepID=UPI002676F73D|nr:four helix bundle protein [Mucilaginibacter sp. L3T2-6]MDO3641641.1 four helix bundle protein [Mucilaginibacter sp. L3T2-6]MDV6214135.1 four helix bundle protein [Mucilaginibacter sp. L3T2-6]